MPIPIAKDGSSILFDRRATSFDQGDLERSGIEPLTSTMPLLRSPS